MRRGLLLACAALALCAAAPAARANPERPAAAAAAPQVFTLQHGETLDRLLARLDVPREDRDALQGALAGTAPRPPRPGDRIAVGLGRGVSGNPSALLSLHYETGPHADVTLVARGDGGYAAAFGEPLREGRRPMRSVRGTAGPDLAATLADIGLPPAVIDDIAEALAFDPDMPVNPGAGTRFRIVYAAPSEPGADDAALMRISLTDTAGREHRLARYAVQRGIAAFVAPSGHGTIELPKGEPVPGGRLTSPWGWRIHPVLKRPQFHKGVDFSAPAGTPVLATADGTVEFVGRRGNYGRLIRMRHGGGIETLYAHLQGFAAGLRTGGRVRQGQVIGYVGRSGLATGNHLYYEVYAGGRQVDPMSGATALPQALSAAQIKRLRSAQAEAARD
ncbi:M23 family metallopeptidase [Oleispirillum naphthae]|uniref:M23 family metallopeptidase n=1 Tax=Oleispirillum naphthae TaxID=2838853 RepID=UPI0030822715